MELAFVSDECGEWCVGLFPMFMVWWGNLFRSFVVISLVFPAPQLSTEGRVFTPLWSSQSLHFHIPPQQEKCEVFHFHDEGIVRNLHFVIPSHGNGNPLDVIVEVSSDVGVHEKKENNCIVFSSSQSPTVRSNCAQVSSGALRLISDSYEFNVVDHEKKGEEKNMSVSFKSQLKLCIQSTQESVVGEVHLDVFHASSPISTFLTQDSMVDVDKEEEHEEEMNLRGTFDDENDIRSHDTTSHRYLEELSSLTNHLTTVEVNSVVDFPPALNNCDVNQSTSQCNLRSALYYCNYSLTINPNSTCIISLPGNCDIVMDSGLGPLELSAETGHLRIEGNGCDISRLISSPRDRLLSVSPPTLTTRSLDFSFDNCSVSGFGSIDTGGAVTVIGVSTLKFDSISFMSNEGSYGGGLSIQSADFVECVGCYFFNNTALVGGGVFISRVSEFGSINFEGCQFDGNYAETQGGGLVVANVSSPVFIVSNTFRYNLVKRVGGGAISFYQDTHDINILKTDFLNNSVMNSVELTGTGGAVLFSDGCRYILISGSLFKGNAADSGGTLTLKNVQNVTIDDCIFADSSATYDSSVLELSGTNILICNTNFIDNFDVKHWGISITPAIRTSSVLLFLIANCTFHNNSPYSIHFDAFSENVLLVNNLFSSDGITLDDSDSGILIEGSFTGAIKGCLFLNTISRSSGGSIANYMTSGSIDVIDCDFVGGTAEYGGAVFVQSRGDMTFSNCVFESNEASISGGAVYIEKNSNVSFYNSRFLGNLAVSSGGGVYLTSQVIAHFYNTSFVDNTCLKIGGGGISSSLNNTLSVVSCLFESNYVIYGGAAIDIDSFHSSILITKTSFVSNKARSGVGAVSLGSNNFVVTLSHCLFFDNAGYTGALEFASYNSEVNIIDVAFRDNYAVIQGGGVYVGNLNDFFTVTDSYFENNYADTGGGIYFAASNYAITIQNSSFILNHARTAGGGVYFQAANQVVQISDSKFSSNQAQSGGAAYFYSNNVYAYFMRNTFELNVALAKGGAFYLAFQNVDMIFHDMTLHSNMAIDGGGVYMQSGNNHASFSRVVLSNNVASGSGGGIFAQDSNDDISVKNCTLLFNAAAKYGGGIILQSSNYDFVLSNSTLMYNVAIIAGGSVTSSLSNENLTISASSIIGSSGRYGGSIYIGSDHERVIFLDMVVTDSIGEYGGAIYVSTFNEYLLMDRCRISDCTTLVDGGALTTYTRTTVITSCQISNIISPVAPGLLIFGKEVRVSNSTFEGNTNSKQAYGCLTVMDAISLTVSNCMFRSNLGYSGGGITLVDVGTVQMDFLSFVSNTAETGAGITVYGAEHLYLTRSEFMGNKALFSGGGFYATQVPDLVVQNISFANNTCNLYGGALSIYYCGGTVANISLSENTASTSGSAIYLYSTYLSLNGLNHYINNSVFYGGGAVFWGPVSAMDEPLGLTNPNQNIFTGNIASYGSDWATSGSKLRAESYEVNITNYDTVVPSLVLKLVDEYNQLVVTDSFTNIEVSVYPSNCLDKTAYITGTQIVSTQRGLANFSNINAYCAPGYSLYLKFAGTRSGIVSTLITLNFRPCVRGEYYSGQECIPCESGTYSLSDETTDLSNMNQISVCHPCPQHVRSCHGSTLVLEKGYWRISLDSDEIQSCPTESACLGGESAGDDSCDIGYEGPLCAVCQSGYAYKSSTRRCVRCSESSGLDVSDMLFLSVVGLLIVVVVYYFSRSDIRQHLKSFDDFVFYLMMRANIMEINEHTDPKEIKSYIRIVSTRLRARLKVYITLYQILSSLPFVLDLQFPSPVNLVIYALNFINISLSGSAVVSCSAYSYDFIDSLVVETIYPIVVVMLLFTVRWIHFRLIRYQRREESRLLVENDISRKSSTYFFIFLLFTYLILPSVATKIFQTFR